MILIIMGVILGIFALAGFGAVMGGLAPDPITSLIVYLIFLLMGIGLILWGDTKKKEQAYKGKSANRYLHTTS